MKNFLLLHYSELALKKTNKKFFLKLLLENLRWRLRYDFKKKFRIFLTLNRVLVDLGDLEVNAEVYGKLRISLKKVFGIRKFALVRQMSADLNLLKTELLSFLKNGGFGFSVLKNTNSFAVRVKIAMNYPSGTRDLEKDLGNFLLEAEIFKKVDLQNPDCLLCLEIFNESVYLSFGFEDGSGGLSLGSQGKMLLALSGGFDSPVAGFRMLKRGARLDFVYFHSYPHTEMIEIQTIKDLVAAFANVQAGARLFLVPFLAFQKQIAENLKIPGKYRVLLYRRMMWRVAESLALENNCSGIVSGEALGQVASQTAESLRVADCVVKKLPFYRPLVGYDKEEILRESRLLGLECFALRPKKDICLLFAPKKPEVRPKLSDILILEKEFSPDKELKKLLKSVDVYRVNLD